MASNKAKVDRLRAQAMLDRRPGYPRIEKHYKGAYVYLISNRQGAFKIGRAIDPVRRTYDLQVGSPFKLKLIHHFWTDRAGKAENLLQRLFGASKLSGEWFVLSKSEVTFVKSLDTDTWEELIASEMKEKGTLQ